MNKQVFVILSANIHDQLINEIKYNKATSEAQISVTTKMREAELLFIDDLGNEVMTDFLHENMSNVIDYRYRNNLPTFITSNYNLRELYKKWQPKIGDIKAGQLVSRIKDFGEIELMSKNWRA